MREVRKICEHFAELNEKNNRITAFSEEHGSDGGSRPNTSGTAIRGRAFDEEV